MNDKQCNGKNKNNPNQQFTTTLSYLFIWNPENEK